MTRDSERATPLQAEMSTGASHTSHIFCAAYHSQHTQTCALAHLPTAAHTRSNRWMALRQSLRDLSEGRAAN